MESNENKSSPQQPEFENAAHELVEKIHQVIQNMPEAQRGYAYQRVGALLQLKPNQKVDAEIMACLEPGFQKMQGRA